MLNRRRVLAGTAAILATPSARGFAQAKTEITISRQPGVLYIPTHIIEKYKLIEKHAEAFGLSGLKVSWVAFSNGGAQQDALISGGVDIINTGTGQLLLLWDRTKGGVKGVVASSAAPLSLISREPRIRSLQDIGPGDKVAVPTVKVSTQAILLQMAAAKLFGPDQWSRFDPNTVQMGHPDALIAMKNASHEVRTHFSAPPYEFYEMKSVPDAHLITTSAEIIGGPLSQAQFFDDDEIRGCQPQGRDGATCLRPRRQSASSRRARPMPSRPIARSTTTRRRQARRSGIFSPSRASPNGTSIRRGRSNSRRISKQSAR